MMNAIEKGRKFIEGLWKQREEVPSILQLIVEQQKRAHLMKKSE